MSLPVSQECLQLKFFMIVCSQHFLGLYPYYLHTSVFLPKGSNILPLSPISHRDSRQITKQCAKLGCSPGDQCGYLHPFLASSLTIFNPMTSTKITSVPLAPETSAWKKRSTSPHHLKLSLFRGRVVRFLALSPAGGAINFSLTEK